MSESIVKQVQALQAEKEEAVNLARDLSLINCELLEALRLALDVLRLRAITPRDQQIIENCEAAIKNAEKP